VEVRLVEVHLLATDRRGRPITDLRADEIVVRDQGRTARVAGLEPFVSDAEGEPIPEIRLHVDAPGGWQSAHVSTPRPPRHYIVFVDAENDDIRGRDRAPGQVIRFLEREMGPSDYVAVASFDGRLHFDLPFTTERSSLAAAIQRAYGRPRRPGPEVARRVSELIRRFEDCRNTSHDNFALQSCVETTARYYAEELRPRATAYYEALTGLVRLAGGLRGHKTVLALSHGVPATPTEEIREAVRAVFPSLEIQAALTFAVHPGEGAREQMEELMRLAIREKVAISFVDRNLTPADDRGAHRGGTYEPTAMPATMAHMAPQMDLAEVAVATGGTHLPSPDVDLGLSLIKSMERGGYVLTYYAEEFVPSDRQRRVSVSTTRRGVKIAHRRGYYVQPRTPAVQGGVEIVLEPLRAPTEVAPGARVFLPFRILLAPRQVGYQQQGDEMVADLTLHVTASLPDGRPLTGAFHFLQHSYPMEVWAEGREAPVEIPGSIELPPGEYRLEALVRNVRMGREWSLSEEIRILTAEAKRGS
jgi:VWFA-related protein